MSHNEAEFRRLYVDPHPERVVAVIDLDTWGDKPSPFVEVRYKGRVAILNPMPMVEYLDVDVHAFSGGDDAPIGVMGMSEGFRVGLESTPEKVIGWNAARLVALLIAQPVASRHTRSNGEGV